MSLSDSWSYPYNETEWGLVSATCSEGTMQSPVDLPAHSGRAQTKLDIMYDNPTSLTASDEHELTWNEESNNPPTIRLDNMTYVLSKVQCHIGSEHTVNGFRYAGSCQFVHQEGDKYVIIEVFISDGTSTTNSAFDDALQNANLLWGTMISGLNLRYYWEYTGSFTTPNCEENVQWIILRDVVEVTPAQVEQMKDNAGIDNNFRDLMPLNGRAARDGSKIGNFTVIWYVVTGYCPADEARYQLTDIVAEVLGLRADEMVVLHVFELHGDIPELHDIEYKFTVVDNTKSFMDRFLENVGADGFDNGNITRTIMNRFKAERNITLKYFSDVRATLYNSTFVNATLYNSTFTGDDDKTKLIIVVVVVGVVLLACFFLAICYYMRKTKLEKQIAVEINVDGANGQTKGETPTQM